MRHDLFTPKQMATLEACGFEKEYSTYNGQRISDDDDDYNKWRMIHIYDDNSQIEVVNETNKSGTIERYSLEWSPSNHGVPMRYNGSKKVFNSFDDLIEFVKE